MIAVIVCVSAVASVVSTLILSHFMAEREARKLHDRLIAKRDETFREYRDLRAWERELDEM